jgi:hypothetical protein
VKIRRIRRTCLRAANFAEFAIRFMMIAAYLNRN